MVSIVIPAFNEGKFISACLDSLTKQSYSQMFEVIVVDNASTDTTTDVVKAFAKTLNIKIVHESKKGRGAARASGFAKAEGETILSTDADTHVPENWIESLTRYLDDKNCVAVTGTCEIVDSSWFTNAAFNLFQPLAMRLYRIFTGHYWLSGFNFGIKKDIYLKTGGFNPKLNSQEDIELSFKVSKLGNIKFFPHMPVTVSGRRYKSGLLRGLVPYATTFINYFLFKKETVVLGDER